MLLGYPSLIWKLCLPHRKPGSSGRDSLQFSHPAPRSPRHLWVGVIMAWVQHPPPHWGCLHLSSLQDRDSESWAWRGQTTVFVCSPVLKYLLKHWCWYEGRPGTTEQHFLHQTWPGFVAPADVPTFQSSGNLLDHFPALLFPPCKSHLS